MAAIALVVDRFPEEAAAVRRLYLKSGQFRSICEDFALAVSSLRSFEARADAHLRPEIAEYRALLGELETEIRHFLELETGG